MNWSLFATVFGSIFLAELGDKTQLGTMLFAAREPGAKITVFVAAAAALVLTSAIGVLAGSLVGKHVDPRYLSWIAGAGFIVIGIITIVKA